LTIKPKLSPTNQSYQIEIEVIKPKTLTIFKEVKITISTFFSNFAFDSVIRAFLLLQSRCAGRNRW